MSETHLDEIAITNGTLHIKMDSTSIMSCTPDFLRQVLREHPDQERRIACLEKQLKMRDPAKFVPEIVSDLEAKAEACDIARAPFASGAYSDAARMLRKALC